jgi:hypothetical protein
MARPSVLLMFAGTAGVLVALFLLWQSIRSDGPPPAPAQTTASEPTAAPITPAPSTPGPTAARVPKPPPSPGSTGTGPSPTLPSTSPASPTAEQAPPLDPTKNLHFGGTQLRAQTKAVEPLVRECVEKAAIAGARPSGTAMLTYHVAKRGDALEVEATGIDNEKTTIENEALLECLHQTAKAMKFVGLPRDAQEIYAARRVTLENGKVTEYKHVTFSYLR